jgi:SAM-dependent methyltransferase
MLRPLWRRIARRLRGSPVKVPDEPSGPELEAARAIAFIVNYATDVKGRAWTDAAKARGAEIDILPLFKPYRREDGRTMSVLLDPPRESYDAVVIDRAVELFEHSWSYAFLDLVNGYLHEERWNSALSLTGTLFIPRQNDPAQRICDARLNELFGEEPREATSHYIAYGKARRGLKRPADASISTLDGYLLHRDAFIENRFDPKLIDLIKTLGVRRPVPVAAPRTDSHEAQLQSQSYRTCSVSTKSVMVQHLAATYFPGRDDLRVVDLGAGTGLNSIELLLNPSGVAHVTMVEPNRGNHWPIALMVQALGAHVAGKVALKPGRVEEYQGKPDDIAMVCHVFSVIPKEAREPFVQNAWSHVAPGGILAVLENMQDSDPVRGGAYNATRFTPEEIDTALGRFGAIRYFASEALQEIALDSVGQTPVFRVVQKPL